MEQHEPELIDYLTVLWRWRWLVMIGTLAGVLVAGIVTWSRPPTYRVVATIEGGDVAEQEVERLVTRLNLGSFRDVQEGTGPAPRVVGEYRRPLVIQLSLDTDSPAAAARILERTAGRAIEELTRLISIQQEKDEAELGTIRSEVARQESIRRVRERGAEALRRSVERLQKARVDTSGRVSDAGTALVFMRLSDDIDAKELMLAEVERELTTDIPRKLEDLRRQGEAVTRRMAAVRRPRLAVVPEGSQPPIRPRPKLNLAIGLTGGLLGSMLLALFLEYLRASRRRLTQAAS